MGHRSGDLVVVKDAIHIHATETELGNLPRGRPGLEAGGEKKVAC